MCDTVGMNTSALEPLTRFRQHMYHLSLRRRDVLNWTVPRVRHPQQADRWIWLVVLAYTQLRLARPLVADHRLPWEKPLAERTLTPYRVRRAFSSLLGHFLVLANVPKHCGRSP